MRRVSRPSIAIPPKRPQQPEEINGVTHVTTASCNPSDPNRRWESLFLVDSGATDCMIPGKALREIGVAQLEFMGEVVGATVIFGDDDVEPILGVTALESVGIEIDPKNQRLKRLPAVRLKSMR